MICFAFDFMGDMAFGGGFELMRDGDMHIPWATRLLLKIPFATEAVVKFRNFTIQCAKQRQEKGSSAKDLFNHLIGEGKDDDSK
ncbi:hypothetical protein ACEPAF_650 [Sanghuangporus sanghuang]